MIIITKSCFFYNKYINYQDQNNITGAIKVLKFLEVKMNEINPSLTEILIKFDDSAVSKEKYVFLNGRLENLKFYMNDEYSIEISLDFDEYSEWLLIAVNILTPDHLMPKDIETAIKVFMDHLGIIQNFYKSQCKIFDKSHQKASTC